MIAIRLDLGCEGVSIIANHEEETAGYALTPDPWSIHGEWDAQEKYRAVSTALCRRFPAIAIYRRRHC